MFKYYLIIFLFQAIGPDLFAQSKVEPENLQFVRQGVKRLIFDENQAITLARMDPNNIIGLTSMHPLTNYSGAKAEVAAQNDQLLIRSVNESRTGIWFGGFNPFATYSFEIAEGQGEGEIGFEFSDPNQQHQFIITIDFEAGFYTGANLTIIHNQEIITNQSIATNFEDKIAMEGKIILQMLGSGLNLYKYDQGKPKAIGQSDFSQFIDLRQKKYIHSMQSNLLVQLKEGEILIDGVDMTISTGIGLADIRAITYENGDPLLDQGRLWFTMSIRGRALPHHIQGVFSMNPSVFDLKLEGIVLFDRDDGLLRNEIASHIFYDRNDETWRGLTTGFSAYANPEEEKQLLAIESQLDPRFGFSVMKARPFGMVGDIEDPHILYDSAAAKWRILTCVNEDGYKAVLLESDEWDRGYQRIAGPVAHNSTGTSIQKIGNQRFCFSGSSEREIFVYTYPELKEAGTLRMDLPPWNEDSGTRVWPNVVQLPDEYLFRYLALMMDRFNYPDLKGPHWTYGALYLYHGFDSR